MSKVTTVKVTFSLKQSKDVSNIQILSYSSSSKMQESFILHFFFFFTFSHRVISFSQEYHLRKGQRVVNFKNILMKFGLIVRIERARVCPGNAMWYSDFESPSRRARTATKSEIQSV